MKWNSMWKRLLWALYTVSAGSGFLLVLFVALAPQGYDAGVIFAAAAGLLALTGLLVFCIGKLSERRRSAERKRKKLLSVIAECVLVALCLGGMLAIRIPASLAAGANEYYAAAMLKDGQKLTLTGNGAADLYLALLHAAFFLLGNKAVVAAVLQIALQVTAAVFLYLAVRRISGSTAAVVVLAFWSFAPYLALESVRLSPLDLFLTLFGLTLTVIAGLWERWNRDGAKRNPVLALLGDLCVGALCGLCCYLDAAGTIVLVFLLATILFGRKPGAEDGPKAPQGFWNNKLFRCIYCLAFGAVAFAGILALIGLLTYSSPLDVLAHWLANVWPGGFRVPATANEQKAVWDVFLLMYLLVVGIFSFFREGIRKGCGVWLASGVCLMALQCFQMADTRPVNSFALLYLICAAVVGNAVRAVFKDRVETKQEDVQQTIAEPEDKADETAEAVMKTGEIEEAAVKTDETTETKADDRIAYIENPLPLPKKSEKKAMDFDYEVPEDDDFDIP